MNPNQPSVPLTQNQPQQDGANVWFDNVLHSNDSIIQPKKSKKPFIIGIVVAVIVMGAGGLLAFLLLMPGSCLNSDDYAAVSGLPESQAPVGTKDAFYTASFSYSIKTDRPTDSNQEAQLNRIATLVRERGSNTSIKLSILSDYYTNDTNDAATKRSEAIRSYLERNGVPAASISVEPSEAIDYSGEIEQDKIPTDAKAYVTLSSTDECQAN